MACHWQRRQDSAASTLGLVMEELESGRSITTQSGRSWRLAARREGHLWVGIRLIQEFTLPTTPATLNLKNMSDASTIFSRFHLAEEACIRLLNISTGSLFKRHQGYVLKATKPCAVAYGCARIRRLVRLGVTR
jgi:hypothetical protein